LSLYINTPLPLLNKGRHSVTQKGITVVVLVVVEVEELVVVLVELELVVLVVVDVLVELVELELVVVVVILLVVLVVVVGGFGTIVMSQGSSKQRSNSLHLLTHPSVRRITLLAIILTEYLHT
jgi:hypothetical protein